MSVHVYKGVLLEFVELGCGMVVEVLSSRVPVTMDVPFTEKPKLCKSAYVLEVLVEDRVELINLSVHWYLPHGPPTGWWSYTDTEGRKRRSGGGWRAVYWL